MGYKSEVIKNYFLNYTHLNSDLSINFKTREIKYLKDIKENWQTTLIHTGDNSQTGGRLKRLEKFIGEEDFMVTYGDGLSNINIDNF